MTTAKTSKRRSATPEPAPSRRHRVANITRRIANAVRGTGSTVVMLAGRVPGTVRATRAGAQDTTNALQTLPNSTLRWMAASSVGLSAGLRLARAPRLIVAAGAVPALLAGAAIALRPVATTGSGDADTPATAR